MKDFFISYTGKDVDWAIWISKILEEANYSTILQAKDFRPGSNFVYEMFKAVEAKQTIAVYSADYFASIYTMPEWGAAFQSDPTGAKRTIIPIKVKPCELPQMLKSIVYVDLVGKDQETSKKLIIEAVSEENLFDLSKCLLILDKLIKKFLVELQKIILFSFLSLLEYFDFFSQTTIIF